MTLSFNELKTLQEVGGILNFDRRSITDEGVQKIINSDDERASNFIIEYIDLVKKVEAFKTRWYEIYKKEI